MITITPTGTIIWWQSTSDSRNKVSIPLDAFLLCGTGSVNLEDLRAAVVNNPAIRITRLTARELEELEATHRSKWVPTIVKAKGA